MALELNAVHVEGFPAPAIGATEEPVEAGHRERAIPRQGTPSGALLRFAAGAGEATAAALSLTQVIKLTQLATGAFVEPALAAGD